MNYKNKFYYGFHTFLSYKKFLEYFYEYRNFTYFCLYECIFCSVKYPWRTMESFQITNSLFLRLPRILWTFFISTCISYFEFHSTSLIVRLNIHRRKLKFLNHILLIFSELWGLGSALEKFYVNEYSYIFLVTFLWIII